MTGIELGIKKAIEGGWQWKENSNGYLEYAISCGEKTSFEDIFLDMDFWKGLGKGLNWPQVDDTAWIPESWCWHLHRFIDCLAKNKDPNDFFNSLLSN